MFEVYNSFEQEQPGVMVAMVHWCQQQAEQLFVVKGTVDWCGMVCQCAADWCVNALPVGVSVRCRLVCQCAGDWCVSALPIGVSVRCRSKRPLGLFLKLFARNNLRNGFKQPSN